MMTNPNANVVLETRRFPDSAFCINPILLYLMSLDYAIIDIQFHDESYLIDLMMPDFNAHPDTPKPDPLRRYARIDVESEGATLIILERPKR